MSFPSSYRSGFWAASSSEIGDEREVRVGQKQAPYMGKIRDDQGGREISRTFGKVPLVTVVEVGLESASRGSGSGPLVP